MKRTVFAVLALLLPGTFAMAQEPVKVGIIAPFSGVAADYGRQIECTATR